MAPLDSPYGRSQRSQQRPYYIPSSVADDCIANTPSRSVQRGLNSTPQNGSASSSSSSTPVASLNAKSRVAPSSAASRLSQISPSAYDRFDQVAWLVDLSSRIGDALQHPIAPSPSPSAQTSLVASSSPASSYALLPRNRVRLPRPSKEFRDLQQKFRPSHSSSSFSFDPDASADLTTASPSTSKQPRDTDSAIEWVQHAQDDFERRRADLERSRQGILKRLEADRQDFTTQEENLEPEAEAQADRPIDPAVERSLLAAKSLQELMRSGGLQSEHGDDAEPGFTDLLANAEPIPRGSAALGPSSLFEANKASDGTLNIEAILQQRAKMAALDDQNQAGPSQTKRSMLDLSQAPSKPAKKPVIEVLGSDAPASSQISAQADREEQQGAQGASDKASTRSSSESADSDDSDQSESDSDAESESQSQLSTRDRTQHKPASSQRTAPHPMDQIAIVNGAFKIIPARSDNQGDAQGSSLAQDSDEQEQEDRVSQDEQMEDASEDERSDADADEDDEDEQMDDQDERDYSAPRPHHQYHDGFGGMSTRDLLFEGPAGDADEPIVLSDSDDDEDGSDEEEARHNQEDEDREMDKDQQDQLQEESAEDEESDQDDVERDHLQAPVHQVYASQHRLQHSGQADEEDDIEADAPEAEDDRSQDEEINASQESIRQMRPPSLADPRDAGVSVTAGADNDQVSEQQPQADAAVASAEQAQPGAAIADDQGDAMPDSEVESEELDEELRWSDIEAAQHDHKDSHDPDLPQSAAVDSAYRAMQGSQPTPGFVKVSQLVAGMQGSGPGEVAEGENYNRSADLTTGAIDPEILASFAGASAPDSATTAARPVDAESSQLERTASQTEADIFDAFTRQDASLGASEPNSQSDEKAAASSQLQAGEQTSCLEDKDEDVDVIVLEAVSQPDEATDEQVAEPPATGEGEEDKSFAPQEQYEQPEAPLPELEASSAQVEDAGASKTATLPQILDASVDSAPAQVENHNPAADEGPIASEFREEGVTTANSAAVPSLPPAGEATEGGAVVEPTKPALERVESTDVLEADVEDNSEDEAAHADIAIEEVNEANEAGPHATAGFDRTVPEVPIDQADSIVTDAESVRSAAARLPDAADEALQEAVQNEAAQPRSTSVVLEDEGIMSGDLADRDSSVERQAKPSTSKAASVASETEDQVMEDATTDDKPAEPEPILASSTLDEREDAGDNDEQPEKVQEEPKEVAQEPEEVGEEQNEDVEDEGQQEQEEQEGQKEAVEKEESAAEETEKVAEEDEGEADSPQGDEAVEESTDVKVENESKPTTGSTEIPTVNEPEEQRKQAEAQPSSSLHSLVSSGRVPLSPASSDRRSTSSFTPSANRLGHRHLHGAAKRNLFAQMTEAASNFASSLTAPLRSLPSLLPIRENQASEKEEDDHKQSETEASAQAVAESSSNVAARQPATRSTKQAELAEYTITTRSHCLYRRLELTDIEGTPAFIVPGCSIIHENARAEKARDLGTTSEQESDDWIDVDPDLLPLDVHQKLSRIVGIQILREGIFAEPDSSAAQLLMDGYELDLELPASFDEKEQRQDKPFEDNQEEHKTVALDDENADVKVDHDMDITDDQDLKPKPEVHGDLVEMEASERVKNEVEETPSRVTRQSSRHRRAGSAASASSHHRSPRRSDPSSANANYLPDDERKSLYRDRHPAAGAPGDASIASLEAQLTAGETDEDGDEHSEPDSRILQDADKESETAEGTEEIKVDEAVSPSPPKRRRGRARKSAASADTSFKPSAEDEKDADQEDAETPAEAKPKKGRGRKRSASAVDVPSETKAQEAQNVQNAAVDEDKTVPATPKSKRPRRGRKPKDAAATDPSTEVAKDEAEEEEEDDGKQHAEQDIEEPTAGSKVEQGGRRSRKRKQAATDDSSSVAEAAAAETVSNADDAESTKQPRRSRRSQGGSRASSASPSKTNPRKNAKRKVLKLN